MKQNRKKAKEYVNHTNLKRQIYIHLSYFTGVKRVTGVYLIQTANLEGSVHRASYNHAQQLRYKQLIGIHYR
jgi:hypothetical protein